MLPSFINERSHNTFQGKVSKEIGITKSNVLREFVQTLLAPTRVFHKKKVNEFEFLIFVIFDVLFIDVGHILDNCRSHWLPLEEWTKLFNYFILQLMVFMSLEKNFFRKKNKYYIVLHVFSYCRIVAYFHL